MMTQVKKLAELLKEIEDQLIVCMRCGMCQAVCPIYAQTGSEADVARGKLALLDGLMHEMFKGPEGVKVRLERCLLCGSCAANCPSGVKILDIFLKARVIITGYTGLSLVKKVIFRAILAKPKLFDRLMQWGSKFQYLLTEQPNEIPGTSCARFVSSLFSNRHFKRLADTPFHKKNNNINTSPGRSGLKAAIFTGCIIDKMYPDIGEAVIKVLDYHEVGIFLPENQGCCGIPALSAGDLAAFKSLVKQNIDFFYKNSFNYLITPCATCTATIKKIWPLMFTDESSELKDKISVISEKTMDVCQFITDCVGLEQKDAEVLNDAISVTYHDPCHLKKSLGVVKQPRELISANPEYQLTEMNESDNCCGMGGSFSLYHYDISYSIGKLKRDNIINSDCTVLATSCPGCMLQISDMLSHSKDQIRVKHAIEIYADTLGKSL